MSFVNSVKEVHMEVREIYKGEIEAFIRRGAIMIDVRETPDLESIPSVTGYRHLPLSRITMLLDEVKVELHQLENPVIFFCRSGLLSYPAATIAATITQKPMYYLAGGLLSDA